MSYREIGREADQDLLRVTGGELFDLINKKGSFTEEEARPLVKQMLDTLVYLHAKGIAHRDLKVSLSLEVPFREAERAIV